MANMRGTNPGLQGHLQLIKEQLKILVFILKISQVLNVGNQFTVFFKMPRESNKAELPLGAKVLQHDLNKTESTLCLACSPSLIPSPVHPASQSWIYASVECLLLARH